MKPQCDTLLTTPALEQASSLFPHTGGKRWTTTVHPAAAVLTIALGVLCSLSVHAQHQLQIERLPNGTIEIKWSSPAAGWVLEEAANLRPGATWQTNGQTPAIVGDTCTVLVDPSATTRFFRLRKSAFSVPPEPATVAPGLPPSLPNDLFSATAFLTEAGTPMQGDIQTNAFVPPLVSVLRGSVSAADGTPLSGVRVRTVDHPEFGFTLSRSNGCYDLRVNGGESLRLDLSKEGFLPAQRVLEVPAQEYVFAPAVVMKAVDPVATEVDLGPGAPVQVVQGSPQTDSDGTRRATLFLPAELAASLLLPDGSTQSVSTLNLRVTEFTVGSNGVAAMPAELPPTSAYTYCAAISADEALAAGARVEFNQAVAFYVDNFIGMPVGIAVPVAYYDTALGAWVPTDDGRVVKVLGVTGDLAELDVNGTGVPADAAALAALGITDAERHRVAQVHPAGSELWRFQTTHLTDYDLNYGVAAQQGAVGPRQPPPESDTTEPAENTSSVSGFGTIQVEEREFREQLPVAGTPFWLHYSSGRVPGRRGAYSLDLPLTGSELPSVLRGVEVEISVAGRRIHEAFPPATNLNYHFEWDGLDAYGRPANGAQAARIRIGYVYDGFYALPPDMARSFGAVSGVLVPGDVPARQPVTLRQEHALALGTWSALGVGLGGWTLDVHHTYDPQSKTLYRGDGGRYRAEHAPRTIDSLVGGQRSDPGLVPAANTTRASKDWGVNAGVDPGVFGGPAGLAWHPEGALYAAIPDYYVVRKVWPNGQFETVAGTGDYGYSGDGGPATNAVLSSPRDVAVGPDGSVYVADTDNGVIRRVFPDGHIETIAGTGDFGHTGDGGPAVDADLGSPEGIAVAPDGTLYIADTQNFVVRRVTPDGIISTIAGTGDWGDSGEGGPALVARLGWLHDISLGPDGSLYLSQADNVDAGYRGRVRRISPDGIISTVAGGTTWNDVFVDGVLATNQMFSSPAGIVFGPNSELIVVEGFSARVRMVLPDGTVWTLVGGGENLTSSGDGGPALSAVLNWPSGLALGPDGTLYVSDRGNGTFGINAGIRRIYTPLSGFTGDGLTVPSPDGAEIYQFDSAGRHLKTLSALNGRVLYDFAYDKGRLASVTDANGNLTQLERSAEGHLTAILAPQGQRTEIHLNPQGYLSSVINPAGEPVDLDYAAGGLLTNVVGAAGFAYGVEYDNAGHLIRASDPAGGSSALMRVGADGLAIEETSAEGRLRRYQTEVLPNGSRHQVNTAADGTVTESFTGADGTITNRLPDGTVVTSSIGPDPRFGMLAPVLQRRVVQLPSGLASTWENELTVSFPEGDPLHPDSITSQTTVNGQTAFSTYSAEDRTWTLRTPEGRESRRELDALGRVIRHDRPGMEPAFLEYDARGHLVQQTLGTGALARATIFRYATNGFFEEAVDPTGRTNRFARDAAGRVLTNTFPDGRAVSFTYDANGNVTSITPPGRPAHTFAYTPVDVQSSYQPPNVPGAASPVQRFYSRDREVTRFVRADGQSVTNLYDSAGRTATNVLPSGEYTYAYTTNGLLDTLTGPSGVSEKNTYDGRLITSVTWNGSVTGSVHRAYNTNFQLRTLTINGGTAVNFSYDADGLLTNAGAMVLSRDAASGRLAGTGLANVSDALAYNGFGEVTIYTATGNGADLLKFDYTYDAAGRIVEIRETILGETRTLTYTYSLAGRLAQVTSNGVLVAQYEYDSNGNLTNYVTPAGAVSASHDAQDRLLNFGATVCSYNAHGELTNKTTAGQTAAYLYDALGTLQEVQLPNGDRVAYVLDGHDRRVGRKLNNVLTSAFLHDGTFRLVAELDADLQILSTFVYGTRLNVPDYMVRGGVTYRILTDHLGSPRLVVNAQTAEVAQRLDYDEFGRVLVDTNPGFQPFGFAGGLYDPDTRLVHFLAREYDADLRRWTMKDPVRFAGGDLNLYAYAANDPVNLSDLTGLGPSHEEAERQRGLERIYGDLLVNGFTFTVAPTVVQGGSCVEASYARGEMLKSILGDYSKYGTWEVTNMKMVTDNHTMNIVTYTPNDNPSQKSSYLVDNYTSSPVVVPVVHTGVQSKTMTANLPGEIVVPLALPGISPVNLALAAGYPGQVVQPWNAGPMILTGK